MEGRENLKYRSYHTNTELDWLFSALGVHPANSTCHQFGAFLLPDGRGYLLPLRSSREAIEAALSLYNAHSKKARLGKAVLQMGLQLNVAQSFLSRIEFGGGSDSSVFMSLQRVFERSNLLYAISLGTPGKHRKPVIQVLTQKGCILGYVKIGWNRATKLLVANEVRVLNELNERSLDFRMPTVKYSGDVGKNFLCILEPPYGEQSAAPKALKKST